MLDFTSGAVIPAESLSIIEEARRLCGIAPLSVVQLAHDPDSMRAAWATARHCFVDNPLPRLFKERFLALMALNCSRPEAVAMRCCILNRLGMTPKQIAQFLEEPLAQERLIHEKLAETRSTWPDNSDWSTMPPNLEKWILHAAVRIVIRRDRPCAYRELLRDILGERYHSLLMLLASHGATQRVWLESLGDAISSGPMRAEYENILKQAPEIAQVWEKAAARITRRRMSKREQKLLAEISRQDRIREALRQSERRFRGIVKNAAFPLMVYTGDGKVVMLNRAWVELSGWSKKEIPDVQTWMRKAQVDRADWSCQDLEALLGWDEPIDEGEQRIRTRNGEIRRWNFTTVALGMLPDGRRVFMRMAVDVTDRRELEDALWFANRRMNSILDAIADGFVALDREMTFIYASEKLSNLFRIPREHFVGRKLPEAFPFLTPTPLFAAIKRCLQERTCEHMEHYSSRLDTYFDVHLYPTEEGLAGIVRDIGDRKRIERNLRASERRFRSLFDSNMLGIIFANRFTGEVLDCNEAMLKITGYTREEVQRGEMNWIKMTSPEERPLDVPAVHAVGNGPLVPYHKHYIHKDGHRVPVLIGGAPINRGDDVVMAFVIDCTEQEKLQQRNEQYRKLLHSIIRAVPLALVVVDTSTNVELWNHAAEKLLGWSSDEVIGKPFPVIPPDLRHDFDREIRDIFERGQEVPEMLRPVMLKSGDVGAVMVRVIPARDDEGKVSGAILLMRSAD